MTASRQLWIVPGAPLPGGRGWRLWYSHAGRDDFDPQTPTVERPRGDPVGRVTREDWDLCEALEGVGRRSGVLTIALERPAPGALHDIHIPELGTSLRLRSLPADIGTGVTFLLASCCYLPADKEGRYGAVIDDLLKIGQQPAFKLLLGDQAYQDVPVELRLHGSAHSRFARRYEEYWGHDAYQRVLRSTPTFVTCDDHEFWNNFPERQLHLRQSWAANRQPSAEAALDMYKQYQRCLNPEGEACFSFDVPPVSFFVADTRSDRKLKLDLDARFLGEPEWEKLEGWAANLQGPGVLVSAQPLFGGAGGRFDASLADFTNDFGRLCAIFEGALRAPNAHDILVLTGDIHTGRYCAVTVVGTPAPGVVHEFVASPASRVPNPTELAARPKSAPQRFTVVHQGRHTLWERVDREVASVDNNIGLVRMEPGRLGPRGMPRVRFRLELWRVRRHIGKLRRLWPRGSDDRLTLLFSKELELR